MNLKTADHEDARIQQEPEVVSYFEMHVRYIIMWTSKKSLKF